MIGAHWPELIVFLIVALVVFGPKRLPEIGGAMGKSIREFKKGTSGDDNHEAQDVGPAGRIESGATEVPPWPASEPEVVHASAPTNEPPAGP